MLSQPFHRHPYAGSSGEVGYFVYAPEDLARGISFGRPDECRQSPRKRKRRGRIRIAFFGATDGHYAGVTMVSQMQRGLMKFFVDTALFEVNSPLQGVLDGLNRFRPEFIIGYTTALKILAEKQREGLLKIAADHRRFRRGAEGHCTGRCQETLAGEFGCPLSKSPCCFPCLRQLQPSKAY